MKSKALKPHRQQKERQEYHPKSDDKNKGENENNNKNKTESKNENENNNKNENENENENENSTLNRTDWVSSFTSKASTDKRKLKIKSGTAENKLTKRKMEKLKSIPKKTFSTNLSKYGQSGLLSDGSTFLNTSDIPQKSIRSTNKIIHNMNNSTSHSDIQESEKTAAALLWIKQLLGRNLPEHLVPLDDAFGKELRAWEECSGSLIGAGPRSLS